MELTGLMSDGAGEVLQSAKDSGAVHRLAGLAAAAMLALPLLAIGQPVGMVADNGADLVALFDADVDATFASLDAVSGQAVGDCALSSDQRTGFSTGSSSEIAFIDIATEADSSVPASQHVRISNLGVDMSLSPDDGFLVLAGGGALQQPLSVVDTRQRTEIATAGHFVDHTSVEFCGNGTLLITTTHGRHFGGAPDNALYDARMDRAGNIALRGHRVASGARPNNSACAPGSLAGVLLDREGGVTSFTLPELEAADYAMTQGGDAAVAAAFSRDGRRLYVRTTGTVEAFDFDPLTGKMNPDWVRNVPGSLAYYGLDQIAVHPDGRKLYLDGGRSMVILDPRSGEQFGSLPLGDTTGICFANAPQTPGTAHVARNSQPIEPPAP